MPIKFVLFDIKVKQTSAKVDVFFAVVGWRWTFVEWRKN